MPRIVYVNGAFVPFEEARISIMDRGFLFADGVYEVSAVVGGKLVDSGPHLDRLERSLREIEIAMPRPRGEIEEQMRELVRRNDLAEGLVYLQVTRGVAERDFPFPKDVSPTLVMFTQPKNVVNNPVAETGAKVISVPDLRWVRRDIKSVALLPQVLAKQEAVRQGAYEAWMVEDGFVTEGSSSSAFIVTQAGAIVVRPLTNEILPGITRRSILALSKERGIDMEERRFTLEEAYGAAEAFLTSASAFVMPIVTIDGKTIGDGRPGPVAKRLRALYLELADAS
jgi:D-alanine transaminase